MRKGIIGFLILLLVSYNAFAAFTWTKNWSSTDDGSPFSGSDIENIQNDIIGQVPTLTGDNVFTGGNTYSGAVTFSGTVTGVTSSGMDDGITRGYELVYGSTEQVIINPGVLYHGSNKVALTTPTHLSVTTASNYIGGVSQQAANTWLYCYLDNVGNAKLYATAPTKADTAGNTTGTLYYYPDGATYYRCVGGIRLGAGQTINRFFQRGNMVMWDVPVTISDVNSPGAWKGPTSCAAAIPSISTYGIFALYSVDTGGGACSTIIRPLASTWGVAYINGVSMLGAAGTQGGVVATQQCVTDATQQIDYYNAATTDGMEIDVNGYYLNIR